MHGLKRLVHGAVKGLQGGELRGLCSKLCTKLFNLELQARTGRTKEENVTIVLKTFSAENDVK